MKWLSLFLLFICTPVFADTLPNDEQIIIAHAGGGFHEQRYLNSLEAVQNAINSGFTFIELDLLETPDNDVVAAHDWAYFHRLTGHPEQTEPISAKQARQRKILGNQTVLTAAEIKEIFIKNPHLYLVTDKIRNTQLIEEKFAAFIDRIIVEYKYLGECQQGYLQGIKTSAFLFETLEQTDYSTLDDKKNLLATMPLRDVEKNRNWLQKHPNIKILVYTINDVETAKSILKLPFVKGIYSDFLSLSSLESQK